MREATKDKSYQNFPMGQEAAAYLRVKRKRLTESSYRDYERALDKLARHFPDLELKDFEPPAGVALVEQFLDERYGDGSPRNYNKNLSILRDFFKFAVIRQKLHGDPTVPIERAKARDVHRTTFADDQCDAIIDAAESLRDRIALRLLLVYGIRKGALKSLQYKHFNYARKQVTIFTKGQKVRALPVPAQAFWTDLQLWMVQIDAQPDHFLMCQQKLVPVGKPDALGHRDRKLYRYPDKPMSDHGIHAWWYRLLARAGVVAEGTTSGERMHKARHTAGQRVLDKTQGNLKAAQKLLGHASIQTTGDIYTDWDDVQLAATMLSIDGDD